VYDMEISVGRIYVEKSITTLMKEVAAEKRAIAQATKTEAQKDREKAQYEYSHARWLLDKAEAKEAGISPVQKFQEARALKNRTAREAKAFEKRTAGLGV
jgi:hypothetical protein